ncbi:putative transcription factor GRAS family [Helianthus annuus]|nr:scarecrow-like protein 30 [Helianthus annuus]KAJ0548923.1 putative transcription factor GRAS family [Helianthus annuus]KAJ0555139.1 putative transcription factor GRAS family [Helianthus annuus]
MDTLYATAMNNYINGYNHHTVQPTIYLTPMQYHQDPSPSNTVDGDGSCLQNPSSSAVDDGFYNQDPSPLAATVGGDGFYSQDPSPLAVDGNGFYDQDGHPSPSAVVVDSDGFENQDHYDSVLKFLTQMLMEEDELQVKPCMLNECLSLQATERSLYDVLVNNQPANSLDSFVGATSSEDSSTITICGGYYSRKRSPDREEERGTKMATVSDPESDQPEPYDEDLLLYDHEPQQFSSTALAKKMNESSKRGRPRGKKNTITQEIVVDLRDLLTQCAQAITNNNPSSVCDLLTRIKQHCNPNGDSTERLAYYFVTAIEARLAGNGAEVYRLASLKKISAAQILKAYHAYLMSCPFHRMSNILANGSIEKLSKGADKLHIIDFGILYGFQWPCFIKNLSMRAGGPPTLHITGIDLPQPGFRPAERVQETGKRLAKYCKRFNVPFKYTEIAKKWEEITVDDLNIDRSELTVVNSVNRMHNILDETVIENSPRDAVLQLIRQINPDMFILGILNGTHNAPFLLNRFREALFHFSTMFDIFDNTAARESKERLLYEQEVFGREVMNVVACEGTARVERPEGYKQWQSRNVRAGFKQVPLYRDKVEEVKSKVRSNYHKDFLVDEDGKWILQGWKGRVLFACSLWKPA